MLPTQMGKPRDFSQYFLDLCFLCFSRPICPISLYLDCLYILLAVFPNARLSPTQSSFYVVVRTTNSVSSRYLLSADHAPGSATDPGNTTMNKIILKK